MPPTDIPIRSTDSDEVIEENIKESRLNNEFERTLVVEAPEGPPPIRATEVPRDNEHREADVTPVGYLRTREDRERLEQEVALGPYVGPIDGEGTEIAEQEEAVAASVTGGRRDQDGNLLYDPGILPGYVAPLPGVRDEDGNLVADHDGDGKAAAHEGPIREAIGAGVAEDESEEDQHGSRSLDDADRDLDDVREDEDGPAEGDGGRGLAERDLGEAEDAGQMPEYESFLEHADVSDEAASVAHESRPIGAEAIAEGVIPDVEAEDVAEVNPTQPEGRTATEASPGPGDQRRPAEDAPASEWREYAKANGVEVSDTANKAVTKSALRGAGLIR